jgi:hypothetical protein
VSAELRLPDAADEDAFVSQFCVEGADHELLLGAITACVEARRMRLAVRLVGLVDEDEGDDPVLARVRQAAAFMVHAGLRPEDQSWSELDEALAELRARRMVRARDRARRLASGSSEPASRRRRR